MSIIDQILEIQNRNQCTIFISAVTGYSAVYRAGKSITGIAVHLVPYKSTIMVDISSLLYREGFIFRFNDGEIAYFSEL